tara:strand:- start:624 stop:758 length:135 start_codon:yes stop_codon:yes gene_type:complete
VLTSLVVEEELLISKVMVLVVDLVTLEILEVLHLLIGFSMMQVV